MLKLLAVLLKMTAQFVSVPTLSTSTTLKPAENSARIFSQRANWIKGSAH